MDDACSCTRVRTALQHDTAESVAAGAILSEIIDLVHNLDKLSLRLMTDPMSFSPSFSIDPITIKLQITGWKMGVNKLEMMSKMWFPALEKSSSWLFFFISSTFMDWISRDLVFYGRRSQSANTEDKQKKKRLKWEIWKQKVNLNKYFTFSSHWTFLVSQKAKKCSLQNEKEVLMMNVKFCFMQEIKPE